MYEINPSSPTDLDAILHAQHGEVLLGDVLTDEEMIQSYQDFVFDQSGETIDVRPLINRFNALDTFSRRNVAHQVGCEVDETVGNLKAIGISDSEISSMYLPSETFESFVNVMLRQGN